MDEKAFAAALDFCAESLKRIDAALSSTAGAMLSLDQFDEITRLRRRIRESCEAGRADEARRAEEMAMAILRPRLHG
jgi:hypothetical protein